MRWFLKLVLGVTSVLLFVLFLLLAFLYLNPSSCDKILSYVANRTAGESLDYSIHIQDFNLDPHLKVHIGSLSGHLKTDAGPVPFELHQLESQNSVLKAFSREGMLLNFKEIRPSQSVRKGVNGTCRLRLGKEWFFELKSNVESLDLEDMIWVNPDFLEGSKGEMKGALSIKASFAEDPFLKADIHIEKPGGKVQARFFEGIAPFLPKSQQKDQIQKLAEKGALIDFRAADLEIQSVQSDQIKVFLHMEIPDYNLILNLNLTVKIDEKSGFTQLYRILGLVKIS